MVKMLLQNLKADKSTLYCLSTILLCNVACHIPADFKHELSLLLPSL
jgi:hypothetical protein